VPEYHSLVRGRPDRFQVCLGNLSSETTADRPTSPAAPGAKALVDVMPEASEGEGGGTRSTNRARPTVI
jgi:hypothetical protein